MALSTLPACTVEPIVLNIVIANEAAEPVELAHHSAVREYTGNISSQRKGPFLTIFGCK